MIKARAVVIDNDKFFDETWNAANDKKKLHRNNRISIEKKMYAIALLI